MPRNHSASVSMAGLTLAASVSSNRPWAEPQISAIPGPVNRMDFPPRDAGGVSTQERMSTSAQIDHRLWSGLAAAANDRYRAILRMRCRTCSGPLSPFATVRPQPNNCPVATPIELYSLRAENCSVSAAYKLFTKTAQATGPEIIGPERMHPGLLEQ